MNRKTVFGAFGVATAGLLLAAGPAAAADASTVATSGIGSLTVRSRPAPAKQTGDEATLATNLFRATPFLVLGLSGLAARRRRPFNADPAALDALPSLPQDYTYFSGR